MAEEKPVLLALNIITSSTTKDIRQEYESVDDFLIYIKESTTWLRSTPAGNSSSNSEDLEFSFLSKAKIDSQETSVIPADLIKNPNILKALTFYLFERRFGWSEQQDSAEGLSELLQRSERSYPTQRQSSVRRIRTGSLTFEEESRIKNMLNTKLDELIKLFAAEEKMSPQLLDAYEYALGQAYNLPVVRSQLLNHIFGWLTQLTSEEAVIDDKSFCHVKAIIVKGVRDVWSAIRNSTVSRMLAFIEYLSIKQFEDIFITFTQICDDNISTWQAKEGAIMAIAGILQCFKMALVPKSLLYKDNSHDSYGGGTVMCRTFGKHHFETFPSFITDPLHRILYKLLSNSQLSIKENANKAFCSFLLRSEFMEVLKSFKEVLLYLAKGAYYGKDTASRFWKFTDANKVDGYIKAAEFLVKHVPVEYILHNWHLCFATFSHYLMHPASTVRQAASSVLKYLAAKQTPKIMFSKLVTQSLVAGWKTDIMSLKIPLSAATVESQPQRNGVKCLQSMQNKDVDVSELWEWREGRLLAYELILKFFITNHIHYTFPAYTLTRAANTANESTERKRSIDDHHKFSVSHNFGSYRGRGMPRHEPLSRSLTMESDPLTQKLISSLVEKEKAKNQTCSLLETMRKTEGQSTCSGFDDLTATLSQGVRGSYIVTKEALAQLEKFSEISFKVDEEIMNENDSVPFGKILMQIFVQTLECVADSRWELRRMANQVLPLISETIRFYDAKILEDLWESHLSLHSSKIGFGACVSLKDSLAHVAKLVKYFENPPGFWKDIERCRLAAKHIVDSINESLPKLLSQTVEIVRRSVFDKLTIISMEILMLSVIHFPQHEPLQRNVISTFVEKTETLFMHAYPQNNYAAYLLSKKVEPAIPFESPTEGLFSCTPKNESPIERARKVQDTFFTDIQRLLLAFCRQLNSEDTMPLLPMILREIYSLIESSVDVQQLFQACLAVMNEGNVKNHTKARSSELSSHSKEILDHAYGEICDILKTKTLETHFTRQYLDVLFGILQSLGQDACLRPVFELIVSKLGHEGMTSSKMQIVDYDDDESTFEDGPIGDELLRIRMLSNDIRQSPIEDTHIAVEDDQEDSPRELPESQALSRGLDLNSNYEKGDLRRSTSPLERVDSPEKDDYDSDWDSWEDETEDSSQMKAAFVMFLNNLKAEMGTAKSSDSLFAHELQYCDSKDRKLIEGLMSQDVSQ